MILYIIILSFKIKLKQKEAMTILGLALLHLIKQIF